MIRIAKFNKQSLKWSAVGLVLFLLLLAVSLTNAKAVDVNPDLVKEMLNRNQFMHLGMLSKNHGLHFHRWQ